MHLTRLWIVVFFATLASFANAEESCQRSQFTFSWQFIDDCQLKPRGGTSRGAALELDTEPHPGWVALQQDGLSDFERDRRAILAMAGGYRTSFDFLETVGYVAGHQPTRPYQSWGTEYVYVAEDDGNFISLQHIMVMQYEDDQGNVSEPMVMKHWRQDWYYQQRQYPVFAGNDVRSRKKLKRKEAAGTWTQSVFQVDDSPRYAAHGKWEHRENFSTWLSAETWRPLPRRESSVRSDYQVLIGTNRHTITPTGWVQEEENYKTVLNAEGEAAGDTPYLAKELGVNRYERVKNFDFSAGDRYWELTRVYWRDVRLAWDRIIKQNSEFAFVTNKDGIPLFVPFFEYAQKIVQQGGYNRKEGQAMIDATLASYLL